MQIRQRQDQPITWAEFKTAAKKRYCSPHYYMEKKMEFYNFKQVQEGKHNLSVDEYKEKFLRLHKYTPEVIGEALAHKFVEGLKEDLIYMMKGTGSSDFLDAVAKAENFEKMEEYNLRKMAKSKFIPTGHHLQGSQGSGMPQRKPDYSNMARFQEKSGQPGTTMWEGQILITEIRIRIKIKIKIKEIREFQIRKHKKTHLGKVIQSLLNGQEDWDYVSDVVSKVTKHLSARIKQDLIL